MIIAQSVPLGIDRGSPRLFTIEITGIDLTNADLHAQIRLSPDAPGDPVVDLPKVTSGTVPGVRLIAVDNSGTLPISWIRLQIPAMATGIDPGELPPAAELGDNLPLYWDMVVTPNGFTADRWFFGPVTVRASVTNTGTLAPLVDDPLPGADAVAKLIGADLSVTLAGAALIQPLVDRADGSAAAAIEAAAHAETKAQVATDAANTAIEQVNLALPKAGGQMTGAIDMNGQPVHGVPDPDTDNAATNRGFVNTAIASVYAALSNFAASITATVNSKLSLSGGALTGILSMGNNRIEAVGNPDSDDDAINRGYGDGRYAGKQGFDSLSADLRKSQTIGEPAVSAAGSYASDSTWIFDQPVAQNGRILSLRIAQPANATSTTLRIKRFTKSGSTFTPVAGGETVVTTVPGYQTIATNIAVVAGEYVGFYTGTAGVAYVTGQVGAVEYWLAAGNVAAAGAFTKQSGGTIRIQAGFDLTYLVVGDARVSTIEARTTAVEGRTTNVEAATAANKTSIDSISADTRGTQTVGEPAVTVEANNASDTTWIFDQATPAGRLTSLRIGLRASNLSVASIKIKRFTKSGSTFTPIAGGETIVPVVAGYQTLALNIAVNAGEYLGVYAGSFNLTFATGVTGAVPYWSAGGDITTATAFAAQGGGTLRLSFGFDLSYVLVSPARVAAVESRTTAVEGRTSTVESVASLGQGMADGAAQAQRRVQTVGRPQVDGVTQTSGGAADNVYVFDAPMTGGGFVRAIRVALPANTPASGAPVVVQRWTKAGSTFTKAAEKTVTAYAGVNTIPIGLPVAAGDYVGVYPALNRLCYTVGAGLGQPYFQGTSGGGNVPTFTAPANVGTGVRLEVSLDVDYFPLTAATADQIAANAAQGSANAIAVGDLAAKAPVTVFSRSRNFAATGAWTASSGSFKRWRAGVLGSNIVLPAGKLITRWVVTLELPAAVDSVAAMLFSRAADANSEVSSMSGDTALWAAEGVISKATLSPVASGSTFYEVGFSQPVPFAPDPTKLYYLRFYAKDASGALTIVGAGQSASTSTYQVERGFYSSSDADTSSWSAISAGAAVSLALRVETDAYQVQKSALPSDISGAVTPDLMMQPTLTYTMSGALTAQISGVVRKNGVATSVSGTIVFPAAASGKDRLDLIAMDRLALTFSRVAGTERTAQLDSLEYQGAIPAGAIKVGSALVTSSAAVVVNTTLFRNLIKVGYEAEYEAHVRRNMLLTRRTRYKAARGGSVTLGGYGDSITGQQGGATPPYTANGDSRDRVGYLGSYPGDTRALVPTFDFGRGVTDNVKLGWNWHIKKALDVLGGTDFRLPTSGTITSGSNVITSVGSTAGLVRGHDVAGPGIPLGAFVMAISGSSVTISVNATANGSGSPVFFSGDGTTATYLNFGIGGTTSANTASATSDGRDNGLWPARIAVALAAGLDLVVIAFGMNERGSSSTYGNLVSMVGQFLTAGAEVVLLGCPRPGTAYAGNSTTAWRYTEDAIEAAAMDAGAAYISTAAIGDDRNLGGLAVPAETLGATDIAIAANHPGIYELRQYGRACVSQLGMS